MSEHKKMTLPEMRDFLANYDGPEMNIMEVCGSHTAAISKNGIRGMLSDKIHLISGPGCPVCVTPTAYVDKLIEIALSPNTCVVTFGDMLRVPGSKYSLSEVQGMSGRAVMVYSPMDIFALAEKEPETTFVFAALGFETTTPVYALLLEEIIERKIENVKLLTALKTMPGVIEYLCENGASIQGYLAPGHVAAVTGSDLFKPLAEKYQIPFAVSGFEGEEILEALCGIVQAYQNMQNDGVSSAPVMNFYPKVVSEKGNVRAKELVTKYFQPTDAAWRGMGIVAGTGMELRPEYEKYDAGSKALVEDNKRNKACCCDQILMGKMQPQQCPLFGKVCKPLTPQGACMVSEEGSCHSAFASF
ncbi:MAG: hydrogenase formation protein HypD [Agathobacter sp.]|nr:hydrogenase formation protein HypD [Agathobacter sp.]